MMTHTQEEHRLLGYLAVSQHEGRMVAFPVMLGFEMRMRA